MSNHLIETVFAIFDEDGDGLLSYKEFIAIMKDRLHRGFKVCTLYENYCKRFVFNLFFALYSQLPKLKDGKHLNIA